MTTNNRFYISWTLMMTAAIIVISANSIFVPATSYIARDLGVAEAVMSSNMVFSRSGMIICMFCFAAFADLFTSRRLAQAGLVICTVSCVLSAIATNIYVFDLARINLKHVENEAYQHALERMIENPDLVTLLRPLMAYDIGGGHKIRWIEANNEYTTQVLYRLGFQRPVTAADYIHRFVDTIVGFDYFNV